MRKQRFIKLKGRVDEQSKLVYALITEKLSHLFARGSLHFTQNTV